MCFFAVIPRDKFRLFYLYGENIAESVMRIRKERSDAFGNELWYQLMLAHLKESPYGKQNHISDFEDMIVHFKHRQELETRIVREIAGDLAVILPAKKYDDEDFRYENLISFK